MFGRGGGEDGSAVRVLSHSCHLVRQTVAQKLLAKLVNTIEIATAAFVSGPLIKERSTALLTGVLPFLAEFAFVLLAGLHNIRQVNLRVVLVDGEGLLGEGGISSGLSSGGPHFRWMTAESRGTVRQTEGAQDD